LNVEKTQGILKTVEGCQKAVRPKSSKCLA